MKKSKKLLLAGILLVAVFLRFYRLEERLFFGWDQVRDAWVMKEIIDDGKWPLLGPVAKYNAFNIGAGYYYLLLPFYFVFNLDPIASGVFNRYCFAIVICK